MKTFSTTHKLLMLPFLACLLGVSCWHLSGAFQKEPEISAALPVKKQGIDPGNLPGETKATIMEVIARREYDITPDRHGILQSPNRRQRLRASYRPGMLQIEERITENPAGSPPLQIVTQGIYADQKLIYTTEQQALNTPKENQLTIRHTGFDEEYINGENGIRQNFIVHAAPENTQTLTVDLSVSGFDVADSGNNALTFTRNNEKEGNALILTYNDLHCWDADGKELLASLHGGNGGIRIRVGVAHARFPVTIDPIVANGTPSNASKTMEINQTSAWFGYSVSSAGDVNGDGYSEVLVGAPKYDSGEVDEGAAFLFPGTANGLSLAAKILQGNQTGAQAGTSVASAGDFNGDGFSDVLVGAPFYNGGDGRVFLYYGSSTGIDPLLPYNAGPSQSNANYGISVATAGDVNGDGMSDILVGAHLYDNQVVNEGAAFLFYGNTNNEFTGNKRVILDENQAGAMMGYSVASAGDINGDGYSDVMVGARLYSSGQTYEGAVFVYRGSASGILTGSRIRLESNQIDARMGHSIAPAGDVNGDGYGDIIVGTYLYDDGQTNEGAAMIYHGSSGGITETPAVILQKDQTEAWFGWAVSAAGDVNGDGYADVLVGARYFDNGQTNEGAAFVYQGSATGIVTTPVSTIESNQNEAWLGCAVASAGDVNGDGYSDIVIGSYTFDNGQTDEGLALIYNGSASGLGTKDAAMVQGGFGNALMGKSLDGAGDVNGDGFDDIIVGAPNFDIGFGPANVFIFYGSLNGIDTANPYILNQEMPYLAIGSSVSGAGDVNGDGFDDVVVGSFTYNSDPPGFAYVYYGSATGINQASKGTVTTTVGNSGFGFVVDGGGDLNGDGYADIVVGAPNHSVNDVVYGAVYVFYGSAAGIGTSPKTFVGADANGGFGVRVAMAGNVNGDNFDDLLVASDYSNDTGGKVFVYHGGATGVEDNPAITLTGSVPSLRIGYGIAAGGDVNGDGFGDILVGAPAYNTSQKAVLVHYGSASGITAANRTAVTGTAPQFGAGVASAGDVNGDGYSDIVVGASGYSAAFPAMGAAYTYHGSVSGISLAPSFTVTGSNETEVLGETVAPAGDVNGDGYSDVLVGSPNYGGQFTPFSGRFQLFYGNNGKNMRNDLRIYNEDMTSFYNRNYPNQNNITIFGVGLFTKSFLGRSKGALVIETRAPGSSFSRIAPYPITTSTATEIAVGSFSVIAATGNEQKTPFIEKRSPSTYVRARMRYSPALSLTGQRFGPWRYLPDYVRGQSIAPPPVTSGVSQPLPVLTKTSSSALTIYPNPASDRITVKGKAGEIQSLDLLSPDGKSVRKTAAGQREMNVKGLPTGNYLLIIKEKEKISTRKVLITQ